MSTVEQIHHLVTRVDRLLTTLREFRSDNASLRGELASTEERASELERQLATSESARQEAEQRGADLQQRLTNLHAEQEEIEATITRTLDQLGKLEIGAPGDTDGVADAAPVDPEPAPAEDPDEDGDASDDAPADKSAVLLDEQPPADDEPESDADTAADTDHREGDDLDIF
ncbi:MAG: hypothetical protein OXC12_09365 [Spirochaetaceae bacterium]|nr:hypothetical protein [Spirochaetaceae bacterium]